MIPTLVQLSSSPIDSAEGRSPSPTEVRTAAAAPEPADLSAIEGAPAADRLAWVLDALSEPPRSRS